MKHGKIGILCVLAIGLLVMLSACGQKETVVGSWEIRDITVLGEGTEASSEGRVVLNFQDDATGTEEVYFGDNHDVRDFTYTVEGDELHVEYESGSQWDWPFALDGDTLTLTQNNREISYTRVEE